MQVLQPHLVQAQEAGILLSEVEDEQQQLLTKLCLDWVEVVEMREAPSIAVVNSIVVVVVCERERQTMDLISYLYLLLLLRRAHFAI